jgi:TonB family protein
MAARSNTNLNPLSGSGFVRKIEMVCDMHGVTFGSPANLAGFVQALDGNKHLAMDFWSLVGRMSETAGPSPTGAAASGPAAPEQAEVTRASAAVEDVSDGRTANGRMLETIVEGVTGQSVADVIAAGGAARRSVGDLASLLAGEDIYAPEVTPSGAPPAEAILPPGLTPVVKTRSGFGSFADAVAGARADAAVKAEAIDAVATEQAAVESAPFKKVAASPLEVEPFAPGLSFIEMKRITFAETKAEAVAPLVEVVTDPVVERLEVIPIPAAALEIPAPIRSRDENKRLVLEPELPLEMTPKKFVAVVPDDDVRPLRVPMQAYAESNEGSGRRRLVGWLLFVVVAAGGGFFAAQRYGSDLRQQFTAGLQAISGSQSATTQAGPASIQGESAASAQPVTPDATEREQVVTETPLSKPAKSGRLQNHTEPSKPVGSAGQALPTPASGGAVSVPRDVMQASRISSVAPIYPEMARQNGIEGRVVLQVIVSKDGTVGHLHVVAGDPVLRSAAMQAVAKWRYWPYLINGEPVDVSTLVTVDFTLGQ